MIEIRRLSAGAYLHDITLTVGAGEVLGLVGSQGSGKSTLLRTLTGRQLISAGTAYINGITVTSPEVLRQVGVAGEAWGLMPRLTVAENLTLFAGLWGLPASRVTEVARPLDLLGQLNQRVEKLRPGEAARLRLARALLHDPPVLLLDEPIGDVDRESASAISFTIHEAAERGKAVLLATFGHPRSLELCSRLVYLEEGRLLQPEPPKQTAAPLDEAPIRHIAARRGERVLLFAPGEIRYGYAQDKSVYVQTADGPCSVTFTLTELEDRLEGQGFFRCHRGFLVNVEWVKEIAAWTRDSYSLILKDGKDVPLSKHRAAELKKRLGW